MHSDYAPSSAARWVYCPGSIALVKQFPEEATPEAAEGDAAHWVAALAAQGQNVSVGTVAPNGIAVDDDMLYGAERWTRSIQHRFKGAFYIEHRVEMPVIHAAPLCFGTPDAFGYDPVSKTLFVWDYKYGYDIVEVEENWQLILYVVGVMLLFGLNDLETRVVLTIVQPRAAHRGGPVRTWVGKASDLRASINLLTASAHEADRDDARCVAGLHCVTTYCPARGQCEAFRKVGNAVLSITGKQALRSLPPEVAGADLKLLHAAKKILDGMIAARESEVENFTQKGLVTGWCLEPTFGRKAWKIPASEVKLIGDLFGVDLMKEPEPKTPAQAVKLLRAGDTTLDQYFETPRRGLALVPTDQLDRKAAKAFGETKP